MITKTTLIESSIVNFTKFGSKQFTLDELSKVLGISKKTIYKHFENKEDLIAQSIQFLIDDFNSEIQQIIAQNAGDSIVTIILIYKKGFEYLKYFKPSFLFEIKKYYPHANQIFEAFRKTLVFTTIFSLLEQAKSEGCIKPEVDIRLICELYFLRMDAIAFKSDALFETYSLNSILEHVVIFNLRGITTMNYSNSYFE
ncbi:TetR/AcrR family transcriptional regulator [Bizionia paragorgiae]|uniref:TetR/AcrR family transcriptional regulator n=1 Tax=Bizionia paragorgiae TaxID=283786 RepID=UPI003A904957